VCLGEGNDYSDRAINYLKTVGYLDYYHAGASNTRFGCWRPFFAAVSAAIAQYSLRKYPFPFKGIICSPIFISTLIGEGSPGTWQGPVGPAVVRFWNGNADYATIEDIEHLLDRKWIARLWTYQEILFAVNPVVVCGNAHICWDWVAMSLIFLDSAIPCLGLCIRPWKRVALSRQQYMAPTSKPSRLAKSSSLELYAEFSKGVCRLHKHTLTAVYCRNLTYLCFFHFSWIQRIPRTVCSTSTCYYAIRWNGKQLELF
jgi:hypothetical protein